MNQQKGQSILGLIDGAFLDLDSTHLSILKLKPNTHYNVECFALRSTQLDVIHVAKPIHIVTGNGISCIYKSCVALFEIRNIKRSRRRITYHLHSNIDALYVCYLMNRKRGCRIIHSFIANVIATIEIDYSEHRTVRFDAPDKYTPLMTKCEMYDKNNQCIHCMYHSLLVIMSTNVEDIAGMTSFWIAIQPYLIICFLGFIIYNIWKNRNPFDPTRSM